MLRGKGDDNGVLTNTPETFSKLVKHSNLKEGMGFLVTSRGYHQIILGLDADHHPGSYSMLFTRGLVKAKQGNRGVSQFRSLLACKPNREYEQGRSNCRGLGG